jgi:hypothetical protein
MGGYNSGRWGRHERALTVRDVPNIRVCWIPHTDGLWRGITVDLTRQGNSVAVVYYGAARLVEKVIAKTLGQSPQATPTPLWTGGLAITGTRLRYGWRWWFICPMCYRRAYYLYWQFGHFACRTCQGLTYESCQKSHADDRGRGYVGMVKRASRLDRLCERHSKLRDELARHRPGSHAARRVMARLERLEMQVAHLMDGGLYEVTPNSY